MGIRMDQHMGLNEWARNFIKGEQVFVYIEKVTRVYPDGREEALEPRSVYDSSVEKEKSGALYWGMFEDKYPLYKYTFPDGEVYFERVQAAPWSSGPVFFLALVDEKENWVQESLWTEEDIRSA